MPASVVVLRGSPAWEHQRAAGVCVRRQLRSTGSVHEHEHGARHFMLRLRLLENIRAPRVWPGAAGAVAKELPANDLDVDGRIR
jgi:hypothetical protein